jgi:hypothetical protein
VLYSIAIAKAKRTSRLQFFQAIKIEGDQTMYFYTPMQPISTRIFKTDHTYYLKKIYEGMHVTRTQLSNNRRFIPIYCNNSKRLPSAPSASSFDETGGFLDTKTGTYFLCNNKIAYSPSYACKLCLTRPRSTADPSTWEWQGPAHTYCQINGIWIKLEDAPIYLTDDPDAPRLRAMKCWGKYISI